MIAPDDSSLLPHWQELGPMAPLRLCEGNVVSFSLSDWNLGRKIPIRMVAIERPARWAYSSFASKCMYLERW